MYTRGRLLLRIIAASLLILLSSMSSIEARQLQILSSSRSNFTSINRLGRAMTPPQKDGDGDVDMDVSLKRRGLELECDNRINDPLLIVRGGAANRAVDDSTASKMNKIRDAIFPVYGIDEMKKFFLLGALKFFIIIVLTITRDTKDTLVVTQCGAEAISFLKVNDFPLQILF